MSFLITTPYTIEDLNPLKDHGADGVVIGTPFFSARPAAIFSLDELPLIRKQTNDLSMEMLMLVNRMFTEEELDELTTYMKTLKALDVDGIYFCDEGVLQIACDLEMQDKLIYQPDTLITNSRDVDFYLNEGLKMVSLAKEITLDEICEIAKASDAKRIEVMIHGRQNMMHSKRELITSYLTHINQPVNMKNNHNLYIQEATRVDHFPILEDELGTHVFTGFTMAAFAQIKAMQEAGVGYFRIDGIFHDITWLCEAVSLYRSIMNDEQDGQAVFHQYVEKYPQDHVTTGFLYQWTGLHKEGL